MDLGLKGKKAIVTGGSRGIGRTIAETLADEGVDLAICARGAEGLEAAAKDLEGRGVRVFTRALDVANGEALEAFIDDAAGQLRGLDILVCNPSAMMGSGDAAWQANFDIDLMSTVRSVEAAAPHLAQEEGGSIVFIATTAAVESAMGATSYGALKAAVIAHAGNLAQTMAPERVRVNVVSPGPVYFEGGTWAMIEKAAPKIYEATLRACPQGRMGTPQEVANAVVFLASPAASLITGAHLVTDGGFTKRIDF
jgi:NAD(P)-dependent dehydrogenase (short-subunit alcohol dehydrogenase family)